VFGSVVRHFGFLFFEGVLILSRLIDLLGLLSASFAHWVGCAIGTRIVDIIGQ